MSRPSNSSSHPGAVGRPYPWAELKVVHDDAIERPRGTPGRVLIKGSDGFPGRRHRLFRRRRLDLTDPLLRDGMRTNVYSTVVERELSADEGIEQCAVIGQDDPEWGEAVAAVIVASSAFGITN